MEKKRILKYTGLFILAIAIIGCCSLILVDCHNKGGEWNSLTTSCDYFTFEKGLFGRNEIYNTCLYISEEQGALFNGYCYEELPTENRWLEGCNAGCELQAKLYEDFNRCLNYCEEHILEN